MPLCYRDSELGVAYKACDNGYPRLAGIHFGAINEHSIGVDCLDNDACFSRFGSSEPAQCPFWLFRCIPQDETSAIAMDLGRRRNRMHGPGIRFIVRQPTVIAECSPGDIRGCRYPGIAVCPAEVGPDSGNSYRRNSFVTARHTPPYNT